MIRSIVVFLFLSLVAFGSYAQDSDRIGQLEKEVQELKARLSKLESALGNQSESQMAKGEAKKIAPAEEGWKSVANWRKLQTDMSPSAVRRILGEPDHVEGGGVSLWHYPNGGTVTFTRERTSRWTEPRQ